MDFRNSLPLAFSIPIPPLPRRRSNVTPAQAPASSASISASVKPGALGLQNSKGLQAVQEPAVEEVAGPAVVDVAEADLADSAADLRAEWAANQRSIATM